HGEETYVGHGRLTGKAAVITGGDSGIGRAVAIAFAREGADVLIAYLEEHDDARETARWVEQAGRRAVLVAGDLAHPGHCTSVIDRALQEFGRLDVLVNNAAYQRTYAQLEDVPDDEWNRHFDTNITAMFRLCKAALPHMSRGSSIVNTASVNVDQPRARRWSRMRRPRARSRTSAPGLRSCSATAASVSTPSCPARSGR